MAPSKLFILIMTALLGEWCKIMLNSEISEIAFRISMIFFNPDRVLFRQSKIIIKFMVQTVFLMFVYMSSTIFTLGFNHVYLYENFKFAFIHNSWWFFIDSLGKL
jgi:hypothetical protein